MEKLQYVISINADAKTVYETMLGEETFKQWTALFNPTSRFEGSWDEGGKIYFVGTSKEGKKEGMVGVVRENKPQKYVSIEYVAILDGDQELGPGTAADDWINTFENYTFEEKDGVTTLTVDIDMNDEMVGYFNKTYPKALQKLKEICEA